MAPTAGKAAKDQRQMSPIGSVDFRRSSGGFMLLDMALALTILLVLFAIAWPLIGRNTNDAKQMATAMEIANLLKADRAIAARDGHRTATRIDLGARTVTNTAGRQIYLPADLVVEITTAQECMDGAQR